MCISTKFLRFPKPNIIAEIPAQKMKSSKRDRKSENDLWEHQKRKLHFEHEYSRENIHTS